MLSAVCTYLHCDPYSITITHDHKFPVIIEWRKHPFPFRTRQLSSTSPMILRGQLCGKVGRRRDNMEGPRGNSWAFFLFPTYCANCALALAAGFVATATRLNPVLGSLPSSQRRNGTAKSN